VSRRARAVGSGVLVACLGTAACEPAPFGPPAGFESPMTFPVLSLAPGQEVTYDAGAVGGTVEIPAINASSSYTFVIHDARAAPGTPIDVRLRVNRIADGLNLDAVPAGRARGQIRPGAGGMAAGDPFADWYAHGETAFRTAARRDLMLAGARPVRDAPSPGTRASLVPSAPAVGQLLRFESPVAADGEFAACGATTPVKGLVKAVGAHFALVEDTAVAGHLTDADYATILDEIETVAFPVDSAYFGVPSDIDANGVVLALVSAEVNRTGAAGFFIPSDLADAADCPTSNEGELLWMIAPDPAREHGEQSISTDLVRRHLAGVIVHELQHLIHTERRIVESGGDFESADVPWLNEGLSHLAEEVSGLYAAGQRTGRNLAFDDLATPAGLDRFERYHLLDMRFMRDYFRDPGAVPALSSDPITRGDLRKARGFGYLFLRWLADQYAADGPDGLVGSVAEEALFRDLAVGGGALRTSVENVLAAVAPLGAPGSWEELFAAYVGMPAVDDVAAPGVPLAPSLRLRTWNLPRAYENARDAGYSLDFPDGFPLIPVLIVLPNLPPTGFSDGFDLLPSTAVYYRLEAGFRTPVARVTVTRGDGSPLPSNTVIRITVIRTL